VLAATLAVLAPSPGARADDPPRAASAKMTCERIAQPGRVRCEVEAVAEAGTQIRWGDVAIVSVPPFAAALKGRIGPREATSREDATWRWALALVAKDRGVGDVRAHVRVTLCQKDRCEPRVLEVTARLQVGD